MAVFECKEDYYLHIVIVIAAALAVHAACLLGIYTTTGHQWLLAKFGPRPAFLIQLYFWAALGATVASARFCANDRERNEIENLKETPDKIELRYPNLLDVWFYVFRIVFSGILGVVGAIVLLAALGYFDVVTEAPSTKATYFFVVVSFLVGMHQNEFLAALARLNKSVVASMRLPHSK